MSDDEVRIAEDAMREGRVAEGWAIFAATDEGVAIAQGVLDGMARTLWVTSYADWVEGNEDGDADGSDHPGLGGDWDDVAPATPDAANRAAVQLGELYASANGVPLAALFVMAVRADAAMELHEVDPDEKFKLVGFDGVPLDDEFGGGLAMMALGHGVSWFDDHNEFPIEMVRHFDCNFHGGFLSWSGMAESSLGRVEEFEIPRESPRIRISYVTYTPGAQEGDDFEEEHGFEDEEGVEMHDDHEDGYVGAAVAFLRGEGATQASSSNWHAPPVGIWYTAHETQNYVTGADTTRSFHLDGFTDAELRAIYDAMVPH